MNRMWKFTLNLSRTVLGTVARFCEHIMKFRVSSEIGNILTGWETTDVFKIALFDWCNEILQDFYCSSRQVSTKEK